MAGGSAQPCYNPQDLTPSILHRNYEMIRDQSENNFLLLHIHPLTYYTDNILTTLTDDRLLLLEVQMVMSVTQSTIIVLIQQQFDVFKFGCVCGGCESSTHSSLLETQEKIRTNLTTQVSHIEEKKRLQK